MERVETQGGKALWRCFECGYIAKKNHMKEHIEAKEFYNMNNFVVYVLALARS